MYSWHITWNYDPLRPLKGELWTLRKQAVFVYSKVDAFMKGTMFYGAGPMIFELAKKLRNNVTATEMTLWGRLKEHFPEKKFRRQHPISLYIVDLYCHTEKLVIEIDGSIHEEEEVKRWDKIRQKDLEELGLRVIRFSTKEIMNEMDTVLKQIEENLK